MSRKDTITGQAGTETIATATVIQYNPVTGMGDIIFNMSKYMTVNNTILSEITPTNAGMLQAGLATIITRRFLDELPTIDGVDLTLDPVTGADLSNVSVAGVMQIMKAAFDILYNEQFAPVPPPTPTASVTPSITESVTPTVTPTISVTPSVTPTISGA